MAKIKRGKMLLSRSNDISQQRECDTVGKRQTKKKIRITCFKYLGEKMLLPTYRKTIQSRKFWRSHIMVLRGPQWHWDQTRMLLQGKNLTHCTLSTTQGRKFILGKN